MEYTFVGEEWRTLCLDLKLENEKTKKEPKTYIRKYPDQHLRCRIKICDANNKIICVAYLC